MKVTGILILFVFIVSCQNENTKKASNKSNSKTAPYIYFAEDSHDFGKVTEGEEVSYVFTFENRGKSDLYIHDVQTSCGCTVSKYEQKPVAPGKTGTIELLFHTSGRSGKAKKTARVISNAYPDEKILTITCEILNKSK